MLKRTSIFLILALLAVIIGACADDLATQQQRAIEHSQEHLVPMPTPALLGALPPGTYPIGGPIIDISGGLSARGYYPPRCGRARNQRRRLVEGQLGWRRLAACGQSDG